MKIGWGNINLVDYRKGKQVEGALAIAIYGGGGGDVGLDVDCWLTKLAFMWRIWSPRTSGLCDLILYEWKQRLAMNMRMIRVTPEMW